MIIVNQSNCREEESHDYRGVVLTRIALADSRGNIVAVNNDWTALVEETGATLGMLRTGMNYLDVCRRASASSASRKALTGVQEVLKGKTSHFTMDYECETPEGPRYIRMVVTPITCGNARIAIAHTDITDLELSKEKDLKRVQQFARRLIKAQEEERQKIAREIHDDLGSRIAMLSLSISKDMKHCTEKQSARLNALSKVLEGIADLSTSLRNLSHRLHPPHLRYLGIGAALKSLREDFERTYPILMNLVVPPELPRLPDDVEVSIFRISQECLQNIGKHSGAESCEILLQLGRGQIRLKVSDSGRGFNRAKAMREAGLGLLSMEERALSIRGRLTVKSSPGAGTEVQLSAPIAQA